MFNLKNSFPVLLFQSKKWTVSKIRKLSCSCSYQWNFSRVQKALVWLNFEPKARVGPEVFLKIRVSGVKFRTYLLTFPVENFFRELTFPVRTYFSCERITFGFDELPKFFFISYRIRIYQLSKSTITKIQLSQQFALQWAFLHHKISPVNSSLYREFPKKDAQQFKSPMSREEEQSTVQISIYEQRRKLHSAILKKW